MSDRADDLRERIGELARDGFAHHRIIQEGPGEWLCRAQEHSHRWFRIIVRPFFVVVWGDIGDWVLCHGDGDSLGWLRRAAQHAEYPGYLLSKIRAGRDREFFCGDALAWLNERLADGDEDAAKVKEWLEENASDSDFTQHDWFTAWREVGVGGNDIPDCIDYGPGPLWLGQAMSWFVAHIDQAIVPPTLEQKVLERIGRYGVLDLSLCREAAPGTVMVHWVRDYGRGPGEQAFSTARANVAPTINDALALVLKHEDDADAKDGGNG